MKPLWYQLELWVCNTHPSLGSIFHSSWQILSSSIRLDGNSLRTAIFRSLHRWSLGFSYGFGGAIQGQLDASLKAISVFFWLYASGLLRAERKPLPLTQVICTLQQVFLKGLCVMGWIHPSLKCGYSPGLFCLETPSWHGELCSLFIITRAQIV